MCGCVGWAGGPGVWGNLGVWGGVGGQGVGNLREWEGSGGLGGQGGGDLGVWVCGCVGWAGGPGVVLVGRDVRIYGERLGGGGEGC